MCDDAMYRLMQDEVPVEVELLWATTLRNFFTGDAATRVEIIHQSVDQAKNVTTSTTITAGSEEAFAEKFALFLKHNPSFKEKAAGLKSWLEAQKNDAPGRVQLREHQGTARIDFQRDCAMQMLQLSTGLCTHLLTSGNICQDRQQ